MHFIRTLKAEKEYNLNGEMWYASDIINTVKEDIQNIIDENSLPVEIEDIEIIGSYTRGENTPKSDLDVLVQYFGDLSDDSLFNILSEEPLELNGVKIDINPINSAKDSIEDFKERNKGFNKIKSSEGYYISKLVTLNPDNTIIEDNSKGIEKFTDKEQAIKRGQAIYNQLIGYYNKRRCLNRYNISIDVFDNEHNLIKQFKNY